MLVVFGDKSGDGVDGTRAIRVVGSSIDIYADLLLVRQIRVERLIKAGHCGVLRTKVVPVRRILWSRVDRNGTLDTVLWSQANETDRG